MADYPWKQMSVGFALTKALKDCVYEPKQRNKDGMRWIRHRFPIKGGISLADVLVAQSCKTNAIFERMLRNG